MTHIANRRPAKGQAARYRLTRVFTQRFGPRQEVTDRIVKDGLTYELQCARLCPAKRNVVIAQYRFIGERNATR